MEQLVEGAFEGAGGELDGRAIVAEVEGHSFALEGVGLALEEGVGVFEKDRDEFRFVFTDSDGFNTFDLGPGYIARCEGRRIVRKAGVVDDEAGSVLQYLAEVEGSEEEADDDDKGAEDDNDDGQGEWVAGIVRLDDDKEETQQDATYSQQEKL